MSEARRKFGRPTKYRPEMCERVVELMAEGYAKVEVCADLGITKETMRSWCDDPEKEDFLAAVKLGEQLSEAWWHSQGRSSLKDKEFNHALWYMNMKNRHGWRDKQEHSGDPDRPLRFATTPFDAGA